jgi:anhydro-N-acetylmuramic acid kinase
MSTYHVIGLMSGTSLDGVDLAFCNFSKSKDGWSYELLNAKTYPYPQKWFDILDNLSDLSESVLKDVHKELGVYFAQLIENFINDHHLDPDFVSSHGHTARHRPEEGITLQLGSGEIMSSRLRLPVINDFRKKDIQLGGQGAPLVPIGDRLLFPEYDFCLNLGGFSNVSYEKDGERLAFDICPVNMALNEVAQITGVPYDNEGKMARVGDVHERLLQELEELEYYTVIGPKSLGREWYKKQFQPKIKNRKIPPVDLLATLTEHIACRISETLNQLEGRTVLITGGGAFNKFLIERLNARTNKDLHIPDDKLIGFKEALIFAFLGVLRMRHEFNVLASVTGATQDHCSGVIHKP